MKIWLINPYDELPGEGPEQRYGCLARMLSERGHEVVWISSAFRHRRKEKIRSTSLLQVEFERGVHDPGSVDSSSPACMKSGRAGSETLGAELPGGMSRKPGIRKLLLVDAPGYRKNVSVHRLWSQWKWGRNVEWDMTRRVESGEVAKPDVVLASTPPLEGALAGLRLADTFGATSVVDVMDDWPETWLQALPDGVVWRWAGRMLLWPWTRLARRVLSRADAVSAQSGRFARRARELGHEGAVHVCYLGGGRVDSGRKFAKDPRFHPIYLGAMGRFYDIECVLQTARTAKNQGLDWRWTLVGEDPEGKWAEAARAYGVSDCVECPGYLQGGVLEERLGRAHVGLVPMDPRSGVSVPYKVGDYLGAGLPVVGSLPGELETLLRESGAGGFYRFGDSDSLLEALKPYAEASDVYRRASNAAGDLYQRCFNREVIYGKFADWVTGL